MTSLRMTGVVKAYDNVHALRGVDFEVTRGEVVALVGDNGAGKSTLIKTLAGTVSRDAGHIELDGRRHRIGSPLAAARLGLAFVHQDLALCDNLDVTANLFLGRERRRGRTPLLDRVRMVEATRDLLDRVGMTSIQDPGVEVGSLSGGQRQAITIARALIDEPAFLVLDEPTAALGLVQTEQTLKLVTRLRKSGMGVVLISHNLNDVFAVADRISVLHLGRNAGTFTAGPENRSRVVEAITHGPAAVTP